MSLILNQVYGIVYRNRNRTTTVFNGRIVAKGRTFIIIRFMNSRGVIVRRRLFIVQIIRAVLI